MTFGAPGKEGARVHSLHDVEAILDVFQRHGHVEVRFGDISSIKTNFIELKVDTSRFYAGGTSEGYLGQVSRQT